MKEIRKIWRNFFVTFRFCKIRKNTNNYCKLSVIIMTQTGEEVDRGDWLPQGVTNERLI